MFFQLMILVDNAGESYPRMNHTPWNGCNLADFVMPFFLFIVGVAIALALKRVPKKSDAVRRVLTRTLKLLFWGLLLQVDMKLIRWCGILQRIALVYMIVALIETFTIKQRQTILNPNHFSIFTAYRWQWLGGFVAFLVYMITVFSLYVPDWSFVHRDEKIRYTVKCGMRGHFGPGCNAVGQVDRAVWGVNHLYAYPEWQRLKVTPFASNRVESSRIENSGLTMLCGSFFFKACTLSSPSSGSFRDDAPSWCHGPFEPEGLLSSISAILSGTIGIHYGHVLIHFKDNSERLKQWVSIGVGLIIIAIVLHFTDAIPINKQLYSISYVCFTAGVAGIVFSALYLLVKHLLHSTICIIADRCVGMEAAVRVPRMDRDERDAGLRNGCSGHLRRFRQWLVLRVH
ncbi:Heparan-alpha-glucosaminide N-acetyltransferase [Linum perenne]